MRYILISFVLLLSVTSALAQSKINAALKHELDSMLVLDQKYRALMHITSAQQADSVARVLGVAKENLPSHLWMLQAAIDSSNMVRVEQIIKKYGYPGETLVGTPANEAVFYIVQHSQKIDQYLPYVKKAADQKELPFRLYAMMLDRSLMNQNKEQIYGTQAFGFSKSGDKDPNMFIWPIKDAATVNKRRKAAGFDLTVEENAKRLGLAYKVVTLQEVEKMKSN